MTRLLAKRFAAKAAMVSLTAHAVVGGAYVVTRKLPAPRLELWLVGTGKGEVMVRRSHGAISICNDSPCRIEFAAGETLTLTAAPDDTSLFGGYAAPVAQSALAKWMTEVSPAAGCYAERVVATPLQPGQDIKVCSFTASLGTGLVVHFTKRPTEQDVAIVEVDTDDVALPKDTKNPKQPKKKKPQDLAKPPALAKPEEKKTPVLSLVVPPPPPPEQPAQPPPPAIPDNMRMVELPDENKVEEAPEDATHLSDQNRDVKEETRAVDTNLVRESKGAAAASTPSDDTTSQEVGGAEEMIAALATKASSSDRGAETTPGEKQGDASERAGDQGEDGQEGSGSITKGMMAMRGIAGRGSITSGETTSKPRGTPGRRGLRIQDLDQYERIVGKDVAEKERQVAAQKASQKKGRFAQSSEAIRSALDNFTPEIKPGNQTALKTKAHPFAVYVARMHRRIHPVWAFSFLRELERRPANDPMNREDLYVEIELSINPDGSLDKFGVVRTSGVTPFDVAALHTVYDLAPYDVPPRAIRSKDNRVHLRWGFARDWRACGTFNTQTYILTEVPKGSTIASDAGSESSASEKVFYAAIPDDPERHEGHGHGGKGGQGDAGPAPMAGKKDPRMERAEASASAWIAALRAKDIPGLIAHTGVPFIVGTQAQASTKDALETFYRRMLGEMEPVTGHQIFSANEYEKLVSTDRRESKVPGDGYVLVVETGSARFAVLFMPGLSGAYRATQMTQ